MSFQAAPKPKPNITPLISALAGVGLLILLAYALFAPEGGRPMLGDLAPDFSLKLLDGSKVRLSDLRGQVVVLNFWSSWCDPCRQEAPALQEVWEEFKGQDVTFLGVSYKDADDAAQTFVREFGLGYLNGADPRGSISRTYGVTAVPETFIIDQEGLVAWVYIGEVTKNDLAQRLARMTSP